MNFLDFLLSTDKLRARADEIMQDGEQRQASNKFGVLSMIFSLIAFVFATVGGLLLSLVTDNVALTVFLIALASVLLLGAAVCLFLSCVRLVWQFKINKCMWTWLTLAVFILAVIGIVLLELHFIGHIF